MVSVWVRKLHLLTICNIGLVPRSDENVGHVEARYDRESLVHALEVNTGREEDFRVERVHR